MKSIHQVMAASLLLLVAGCGGSGSIGGGGGNEGDVAGVVVDINGDVVRGARVYVDNGPETTSNSSGAYVLDNVPGNQRLIRARIVKDGIEYYGENLAQIFDDERSKSVNITVVRNSQRAQLTGIVLDRFGNAVRGARVFAHAGNLSSTVAMTNDDGEFIIDTLLGGVEYQVVASARTYNSDEEFVTIPAGDSEDLIFTLSNETNPTLQPPANLEAVAWTSPEEVTRSPQQRNAIAAIKRLFDPRVPAAQQSSRTTLSGGFVEIDLFFDPVDSLALLGYGVYRRQGTSGSFTAIDFLRDPLTFFYADNDDAIREFQTYSYVMTSLNTSYPDFANSESADSNVAVASTLDDLELNAVQQGPLRFSWQSGSGAEEYVVFLFEEYPGIGVSSIWNNADAPVTGNQLTYTGPALQGGKRYYYVVLGLANDSASRTISIVDDFIAN